MEKTDERKILETLIKNKNFNEHIDTINSLNNDQIKGIIKTITKKCLTLS